MAFSPFTQLFLKDLYKIFFINSANFWSEDISLSLPTYCQGNSYDTTFFMSLLHDQMRLVCKLSLTSF